MRQAVVELVALGRLPSEDAGDLDQSDLDRRQRLLAEIGTTAPTATEAVALLDVFPGDEDSCFGLAWALVHIVESSRDWPVTGALDARSGWWIELLRYRTSTGDIPAR